MSTLTSHSRPDKAVDFKMLTVTSTSFQENEMIPASYTCDGENISPPLTIAHIPEETKSLALIMEDPDAPGGSFVHWLVWNMPVTHQVQENNVHGIEGMNDFGYRLYGGPCPPSGTHHYIFKVYALDALLELPHDCHKSRLEKEMSEHIIGFGELTGIYQRHRENE